MVDRIILKHDIIPIISRIYPIGIKPGLRTLNALHAILWGGCRVTGQQGPVIHFHVIHGINDIYFLGRSTHYHLVTNRSINTSLLSFLGRDQNYTVSPASPVHRRSRCVLHHAETLDILRNHTGKVQLRRLHPVNQDQRVNIGRGLKRSNTPDIKFRVHLFFRQRTGNTSRLPTDHTGNFSGKLAGQITTGRF